MNLFWGIFKKPLSEYDTVICHVCHVRDGFDVLRVGGSKALNK